SCLTAPVYLVILGQVITPHPDHPKEARMGARRYGSSDGPIKLTEYHESRKELDGLPVTSAEKITVTNTPNIFSSKAHVLATYPALVQRYITANKVNVVDGDSND